MSAHLMYQIHGTNSRGKDVFVIVKATTKPEQETAEWLIRQKFPSATDVYVTIPAAHKYPKPTPAPVKVATMATEPIRRAG